MELQKETKPTQRHGKWYDDACGTAFALELVGERWSLLIVRELMFGGRRFSDLRAGLPGISAKVLTERLEGMERAKIVQRRQLPPPISAQVYELTAWGYKSEDAIKELGRWAATSPDHDPTLPLSPASLMLSFRTMFDGSRAGGLDIAGAIRLGHDRFFVEVKDGKLRAERGEIEAPDFVFEAPAASPIAAAVYGKVSFEELAVAGLIFTGNRDAALAYIDCFHLPEKIY
ncbi:helix-turn-helix transcriptional regulator [Novosphingobium sp. G106]|nr:helix-turn-helix domain-containing protein [Novosphingobium sp. G106]MBV1688078.1 helix-turn-helix transcriptional regulator [Novosphingobium sp. G106]